MRKEKKAELISGCNLSDGEACFFLIPPVVGVELIHQRVLFSATWKRPKDVHAVLIVPIKFNEATCRSERDRCLCQANNERLHRDLHSSDTSPPRGSPSLLCVCVLVNGRLQSGPRSVPPIMCLTPTGSHHQRRTSLIC